MRACVRAAVAAVFLVLAGGMGAQAHDAASGWRYPAGCCGGQDCTHLEAGDLRYTLMADGTPAWLVVATGEVIPAAETRASPDRMNHRCVYLSGDKAGMTRKIDMHNGRVWCLWIAAGSF